MFRDYKDYDFTYDGRVWSFKTNKWMKPYVGKDGYQRIALCKNGGQKTYLLHRAEYEAVSGNPIPEGYDVNHIDENKTNNHFDNLNLLTRKENINHGTHNERVAKSNTNNPKLIAALTNHPKKSKRVQAFDKEGNLIYDFPSTMEAERQFGFNNGSISQCCNGKRKTAHGYIWKYA